MKKLLHAAAAILCAAGLTCTFAACGDGDKKPEKPDNGGQQIQVPTTPQKTNYDIIDDGVMNADVLSGTAEKQNGNFVLSSAVAELKKPVILPLGDKAEWEISFKGTVMPNGAGGGQLLNSLHDGTDGKIYLGVNGANGVMFMGVCIGDTYANYCWNVPLTTLSGEHEYEIDYENGKFTLQIDDGTPKQFESVNVNQANRTDADGTKASRELTQKIRAVTGQNFFKFTHMGANSHPCTNVISELEVETTSTKGYEENYLHPLSDRVIYYLGSSVTRGHGGNTDGTSFAEMTASLTGSTFKKEAISGTNLAIVGGRTDSYAERLSRFNLANSQPDVLVVQLSTNDFSGGVPAGTVSDKTDSEAFNKNTITGAIEYIIARATELSPETKIVLYTCPLNSDWGKYGEYGNYGNYVNGTLKELESKWQGILYVLDLYNADYVKVPSYIQGDNLHPQKEGYAQVFTPFFINLLEEIF